MSKNVFPLLERSRDNRYKRENRHDKMVSGTVLEKGWIVSMCSLCKKIKSKGIRRITTEAK